MTLENDFTTILQLKNLVVTYHHCENWLYAEWIGKQNFQTVTFGCEVMLEALKEYKCVKVLNDNTLVTGTWSEASEWGAKDWFPRMEAAGLKYFAWIYSPDYYSQMSADKTLVLFKNTTIFTFSDKPSATEWLQSQPNS